MVVNANLATAAIRADTPATKIHVGQTSFAVAGGAAPTERVMLIAISSGPHEAKRGIGNLTVRHDRAAVAFAERFLASSK